MTITQISIFMENKQGRLAKIVKTLADNSINIRALSMADTSNYGILRLIVDNTAKAESVLKESGFAVSLTQVIAIRISDTPGGLSESLIHLTEKEIGIEYMYAFTGTIDGAAYVIIRVEDAESTAKLLLEKGEKLLDQNELINF